MDLNWRLWTGFRGGISISGIFIYISQYFVFVLETILFLNYTDIFLRRKEKFYFVYTGNFLMDALISGTLGDYHNLRIKGSLPMELPIDSADMVYLFGNAFENARKENQNDGGKIKITFHYSEKVLQCSIQNATQTTQDSAREGGLGISIMESIIDDGEFTIKEEENVFAVLIHIPL